MYIKNAENVIFSAFLYDLWGMDSVFTIILLGLAPFLLILLLFRKKKEQAVCELLVRIGV